MQTYAAPGITPKGISWGIFIGAVMFNPRIALNVLNGNIYANAKELRAALAKVVWDNRNQFPADFGATYLAEIIQENGWYKKTDAGKLIIIIK